MDTFVLCLGKKSATARLQKEMTELAAFCPERKAGDRFGMSPSFNISAELGESIAAIFDQKVRKKFLSLLLQRVFRIVPPLKSEIFCCICSFSNFNMLGHRSAGALRERSRVPLLL